MTKVTKIEWTITTRGDQDSGTDTEIDIQIYRDDELIKALWLEPGGTSRLDRGETMTYYWEFEGPDWAGFGPCVDFPDGVQGHLRVRLVARGDDMWEKDRIESIVHSLAFKPTPSVHWVANQEGFVFDQDVALSTDASEGYTSWTLNY